MELLHFQRCDRFYEIINENLELLVPVELAERAIDALRKRQRQTGKFLT